jgi:hypothetical protein
MAPLFYNKIGAVGTKYDDIWIVSV